MRVDPKVLPIIPTPHLHPFPNGKGKGENERIHTDAGVKHNIVWLRRPGTPSNCVIFRL